MLHWTEFLNVSLAWYAASVLFDFVLFVGLYIDF